MPELVSAALPFTGISMPPFGERKLDDTFDAWLYPTAIPHLTLWIVLTVVVGIVLGFVPRWLGARRK